MRLIYGDVLMDLYANRLELLCERYGPDSSECGVLAGAMKLLEAQPTIEERKTGEWIITAEFEDCYYAKCNQCNTTQVFYGNKSLTNFCPDCGSQMMMGEQDDTD